MFQDLLQGFPTIMLGRAQPMDNGSLRLRWDWARLSGLPLSGPACLVHMPGTE